MSVLTGAGRPNPLARMPRATVPAAIFAGAIGPVALWWHDTIGVRGLGDWLTNGGRLTGLLAGYTVAVLLFLMARVPLLERGVGSDRLARWHASGGRYVVCLASTHALLVIWGYAVTARTNVVAQTGTLLTSYPDVLMATVALGLLVIVGYFSATAIGALDPSALVKGWSVGRVAGLLRAAGLPRFAVNGGGDLALGSAPEPGGAWRVGIADPHRPGELAAVVRGNQVAVATSGTAERGAHVVDPLTGRPATELASVTVVGPDIADADAYATAALAMGRRALAWVEELPGYEALVIDRAGGRSSTIGLRAHLAP